MKILTLMCFLSLSVVAIAQSKKDNGEDYNMPSAESRGQDQTEDMAKKLKLTEEQKSKVLAINIKYAKNQEEFYFANKDAKLSNEIMMKKIKDFKILYDYNKDNEMKAVLDEKQFSKYLKNKDIYGNRYSSPMRSNTGYSPQFNRYGGVGYRGY